MLKNYLIFCGIWRKIPSNNNQNNLLCIGAEVVHNNFGHWLNAIPDLLSRRSPLHDHVMLMVGLERRQGNNSEEKCQDFLLLLFLIAVITINLRDETVMAAKRTRKKRRRRRKRSGITHLSIP